MTEGLPSPGKRSPKAEVRCDECRRLESLLRKTELALGDAERQLQQSQKMEALGTLVAGVAHEINNPLTGVLTYTHMLLRRKDITPDMRSDLEIVADRGFWPGLSVSLKHNSRFAAFCLLSKGAYPSELDIPLPFSGIVITVQGEN